MFNNILKFSQEKLSYLYENSIFLQNIDCLILSFIILTFVTSTFMSSDSIGFFALITIFLSVIKILTKPKEQICLNGFETALVIYFLIVFISLCGSSLFALSLKGFFKTFVYIGFYFSIAQHLKNNKKNIPLVFAVMALCTAIEAIPGFLQSFMHLDEISGWQDKAGLNPEDILSRVYGTLQPFNPNLYGGYLVCGLPSIAGMIFYFLNKKSYKLSAISLISTLLTIYTIFQTGCRGAYLAMILIIICAFLICAKFLWKKFKKIYLAISTSIAVLFLSTIVFSTALKHRIFSIFAMRNDSSNSFRFNVYNSSFDMFKDNWLLGIGVGNKNFREIYGLYMKTGFDALSAYNIYLETAVESGIFALIAFIVFLFMLSKDAVKYILKTNNTNEIIFISASAIAIWGVMFHGLVDTVFFRPQLQFLFWSYTAIISAIKATQET